MQREPKIRWTKNQKERLRKAVRSYNRKLTRERAKLPNFAHDVLPQKASVRDLTKNITSARQLNNTINRLNRIKKKGSLEIVEQGGGYITRYQQREFSIMKSVRERKKSMQRKKLDEMGKKYKPELLPDKRKIQDMEPGAIQRFIETQSKYLYESNSVAGQRYKDNYLTALENVFNPEDSRLKEIKLLIEDLNYTSDLFDDAGDINYIYDPIALNTKLDNILNYWRKTLAH